MKDNPYAVSSTTLESKNNNRQSVETYMLDKNNRVLGRRWAATFIDFAVGACILMLPDYFLGNVIYQKTIWIWLCLLIAYFPLLEGFTGYSVGKFICRIRVVDKDGHVPGLKKATIRTLLRLVEVNPFLMGGVPAGLIANFSKYGQRLGDMAAGTYVIASNEVCLVRSDPT